MNEPGKFAANVYQYLSNFSFDGLVNFACFVGVPFLMVLHTKFVNLAIQKYPELSEENVEDIHNLIRLSSRVLDAAQEKGLIRTDEGLIKYMTDDGRQLCKQIQKQLQMIERYNLSPNDWHIMLLGLAEMDKIFTSKKNRDNASGSRKAEWATTLASDLVSRFDKFSAAWKAIDKDGLKIYRGMDDQGRERVHYSSRTDGDMSLTKGTFRVKYWTPAKKN